MLTIVRRALAVTSLACFAACSPPANTDAGTDALADGSIDASPLDGSDTAIPDVPPDVQPVTATTTSGPVAGRSFGPYTSFLGIPYAAPPTGALRWRPPVPPTAWTAPRDATVLGSPCPQTMNTGSPASTDENCLFVNVWTPSATGGANRPVMVFIHGGGFTAGHGGNPLFDGALLAQRGVVVVTLNYRLGQFGFLAHPALEAEDTVHHSAGNYGFLDQVLALQWVRDNIAGFGGDPANVTIFGESAGAVSVCGHLVSPLSAGLFRRAITESGTCGLIFMPLHDTVGDPNASADSLGHRFATALACDTATDVAACLRAKSAAEVLAAEPVQLDIHFAGAHYMPNVDGYVFPQSPWLMLLNGTTLNATQVLGGVNHDEGTGFTLTTPITTETELRALITTIFPNHVTRAMEIWAPSGYPSVNDAANAFIADAIFVCPARALAHRVAALDPHSYLYFFTRVNNFGRVLGLGAFHGAELPYVFGNFVSPFTPSNADTAISNTTMGYWTRFAATGDPNGEGAVAWPALTDANDAYLEIGNTTAMHTALHEPPCDEVAPWISAR